MALGVAIALVALVLAAVDVAELAIVLTIVAFLAAVAGRARALANPQQRL